MFQLIEGLACLNAQRFESNPDEKSTPDIIALNACFAALAAFQARQLFDFAVATARFFQRKLHTCCVAAVES